ncbi:hypothetical protein EDD85DRAFT_795840 [Armillaria nabsnona]|nr:hypothetical protein EDD85DRAFT_795840 [Armillaria nabsnona]
MWCARKVGLEGRFLEGGKEGTERYHWRFSLDELLYSPGPHGRIEHSALLAGMGYRILEKYASRRTTHTHISSWHCPPLIFPLWGLGMIVQSHEDCTPGTVARVSLMRGILRQTLNGWFSTVVHALVMMFRSPEDRIGEKEFRISSRLLEV